MCVILVITVHCVLHIVKDGSCGICVPAGKVSVLRKALSLVPPTSALVPCPVDSSFHPYHIFIDRAFLLIPFKEFLKCMHFLK
jgi:hypothetical protein